MVGYGKTIHTQLARFGDELWNAAEAIKQAIFGVDVKVGEAAWHALRL
jgi:hypothetical protein